MEQVQTKKCPFCAEEIKSEAIKCKHCHSDLTDNKQYEKNFGTKDLYKQESKKDETKIISPYTPEYKTKWEYLNMFKKKSISRSEFFMWNIPLPIILFVTWYIILMNWEKSELLGNLVGWYGIVAIIFYFIVYVASVMKRGQDINKTGPILVLAFVPWINIIFCLYLLLKRGSRANY